MVVNKKGLVELPVIFMVFILVIVFAIIIMPSLSNVSSESRTNLDCTNDSISDYDKSSCMAIDSSPFIFVGALLAIAGGIIGIRWLS